MSLSLENKEGDEKWRGSCLSRLKDLGRFSLVKSARGHYSSLQVKKHKSSRWPLVILVEVSFHTSCAMGRWREKT